MIAWFALGFIPTVGVLEITTRNVRSKMTAKFFGDDFHLMPVT